MQLRSRFGSLRRFPLFCRTRVQCLFGLAVICGVSLEITGLGVSVAIAQETIEDLGSNGDSIAELISSNEPGIEDFPVLFVADTPSDDDASDDGGPVIQPYYRNLEQSDDDVSVDDPLWCGGGLEPPFIYYMTGGVFTLSSLTDSAQTPNQISVATQLDALSGNTTPEIQAIIDQVGLLSPNEQRAAFDSLSGESYGTLSTIGLQIGDRSLRIISDRLINNLTFLSGGSGVLLGQRSSLRTATSSEELVRGQSPVFGVSGWMQGYGSSGSWGNNGNAAGADYRMGGFAYGADLAGDETGVFGISGGHSYTSLGTDRGDSGNVTSHQVGIYLLKNFESFYGLGIFNYGYNSNRLTRLVTIGPVQQLVASSLKSNQFGTYGEAGVNLDTEAVRFQPFFGLEYLSLSNGSAYEGPGGGVGLNIAGNSVDAFQTHLGTRLILQTLRSESGIEFRPYLNARWVADLLGTDRAATASFGGAPAGASWTVVGNHAGRQTGQAGVGFTAQVADGVSLFGNFDCQFGENFSANTGSGGVLFEF